MNILGLDWNPAMSLRIVLNGLLLLFTLTELIQASEYSIDPPLNQLAGQLLTEDRNQFVNVVKRTLDGAFYDEELFDKLSIC